MIGDGQLSRDIWNPMRIHVHKPESPALEQLDLLALAVKLADGVQVEAVSHTRLWR